LSPTELCGPQLSPGQRAELAATRSIRPAAVLFRVVRIARIVDEATGTVTALIAAMLVKVRLAFLVELGGVVDRPIRIIDHAADAMATIVAAIGSIIAGRMMMILVRVLGHPLDKSA
jgi:hypothetical protein